MSNTDRDTKPKPANLSNLKAAFQRALHRSERDGVDPSVELIFECFTIWAIQVKSETVRNNRSALRALAEIGDEDQAKAILSQLIDDDLDWYDHKKFQELFPSIEGHQRGMRLKTEMKAKEDWKKITNKGIGYQEYLKHKAGIHVLASKVEARKAKISPGDVSQISYAIGLGDKRKILKQMIDGTSKKKDRSKFLTDLICKTAYTTGMRPSETLNFEIYAPSPDIKDPEDDRMKIYREAPLKAIVDNIAVPVDQISLTDDYDMDWSELEAHLEAHNVPMILSIKSAKTRNQVNKIPYRVMHLQKVWPHDFRYDIFLTKRFQEYLVSWTPELMIKTANRYLQIAGEKPELFPHEGITLYAFRHSFASRAKSMISASEVAALLGHSSAKTTYGYGARALHSNKFPAKPDPMIVQEIEAIWEKANEAVTPSAAPNS